MGQIAGRRLLSGIMAHDHHFSFFISASFLTFTPLFYRPALLYLAAPNPLPLHSLLRPLFHSQSCYPSFPAKEQTIL